ncbi:MAG: hypothetical protein KGQ59_00505, partial [Bdellovibrionales bacterium]|nr:hypothetical protein [Bdellovibrionales bacterium]
PLFLQDRSVDLVSPEVARNELSWIASHRAQEMGVPGVLEDFCYDPVHGSQQTPRSQDFAAFMISPVKNLSPDRISSVLLNGPSAEISFE